MVDTYERFIPKIDFGPEHWQWTAHIDQDGYGRFWCNGAMMGAHLVAFALWNGPLSDGHDVHHTCKVRHCVNPNHLEQRPFGEHVREHRTKRRICEAETGELLCLECGREIVENNMQWTPSMQKRHYAPRCRFCLNKSYRDARRLSG